MGRKIGSKNKNVNTAKNKNVININVNSSTSKKGKGRPRKTTNNTSAQNRPPTYGGGMSMAPPQVIISQPQADNSNNNSLLSSFITSKMLNETMNLNRTVEPSRPEPSRIEPSRPEPSYFAARESMIPKLPDTPIKTTPRITVKPSPKIESEIKPVPEPPKIDIKPADVAPPKKKYPNLKTVVSDFSNSILEDAVNEIDKENKAATLIGSALRGHKGRLKHTDTKEYPKLVNKRLEQVKQMDPQDLLQLKPKTGTNGKPLHIQKLEEKKAKEEEKRIEDKDKLDRALLANPIINQDLENKTLKNKSAINIQTAIRGKIARNKAKDLEGKIVNIQSAMRGKIARNKAADVYIEKQQQQQQQQQQAAAKIQAVQRGIKTRNTLNTNPDFQNQIDMQIKKYGDAASEYYTRGKDSQKVNEEFSNIMKTMRKGLQSYKTTLGVQPKKRGPKPRKPEQNEF
jgi:hypothetical protein